MSKQLFHKSQLMIMLTLAIPLIVTGFIESSVGFTSTYFLAQLGKQQLAAGGLVSWCYSTLLITIWGIVMSISVLVSHHDGAKQPREVAIVLRDGLLLSLLMVLPITLLLRHLSIVLIWAGQSPQLIHMAVPYMQALSWSILPDFLSLTLLQFIVGLGHTRTNLVFSLVWVPVNILCNYMLAFGKYGAPHLGITGLGWGTTISFWVVTIVLLLYFYMQKRYRQYTWVFAYFGKVKYILELIRVGFPIGLMWLVEVAFFFFLTLIMGAKGLIVLDANQIVMQYVAFFVSSSFAVSQAITVRMGNQIGAKNYSNANQAIYTGILIAVALSIIPIILYFFTPEWLLSLDFNPRSSNVSAIYNTAIGIFAVAALFQGVESVRISLFGALRALKDTRFTLWTSFLAFWCVAIPMGYVFSELLHLHAIGFWWAMVLGAIINAGLLLQRYRVKFFAYMQSGAE